MSAPSRPAAAAIAALPDPGPPTPFFRFYRLVARAVAPLAYLRLRRKLRSQGTAENRIPERLGHATLPRPPGVLLWIHAASVGESVSVLTLVARLLDLCPDLQVLITSGTGTSAQVLASRLPDRCRHQFAPLDSTPALRRFLDHWHPDAVVFIESELWPQMVSEARALGAPLALLNARMSATSLKNWGKFPDTARWLLSHFTLIRTQDQATADGLRALGADTDRLARGPNLKAMSAPLPVDAAAVDALRAAFADAPLWLAASTHAEDEAPLIDAHLLARKSIPDLRLIIVPRHPERCDAIIARCADAGLSTATRSRAATPGQTDVYIADTLGELGLFYALAPLVFLGGSFGAQGGHNLFEPARAGAAILHGPHVANFAESYDAFDKSGAALAVRDAATLGDAIVRLIQNPDSATTMADRARKRAADQDDRLDAIARLVQSTLLGGYS